MNIYIIKFLFLISTFSFAQIQYGGAPKYLLADNQVKLFDVDHTLKIDNDLHPMVLHYADEYLVDINILDDAVKIENQSEIIFTLGIRSQGAKALGFIFDEFHLTENSKMFIYSLPKSFSVSRLLMIFYSNTSINPSVI